MPASETPSAEMLTRMAQSAFLRGLDEAELRQVYACAGFKRVEAETFLFFQGDEAQSVMLIVQGMVKLSQVTEEGQQVLMEMVSAGGCIGVVAMFGNQKYPVSAQAVVSSEYLYWDHETLNALLTRFPQLALNIIRILTDYIEVFQERIRALSTQRVERRLARTLLRLAQHSGKKTSRGVLINLPLSRQDLAELTGTTIFTVSRILSQWESQGLIRSSRKKVEILFPHGLASVAEDLNHG